MTKAVPAAGIALFCVILIYLALQIRAGADPAIGAGHQKKAQAPRQILVRKVIITRVIEEDAAPAAPVARGSAPVAASAPAPAPAAPAPAPAAPAPAPVVSGGS